MSVKITLSEPSYKKRKNFNRDTEYLKQEIKREKQKYMHCLQYRKTRQLCTSQRQLDRLEKTITPHIRL